MFLVLINYLKPIDEVEKGRPPHREFLDKCVRSGHLIVSGPRADHKGGVLLARARDLAEVSGIFAKDPFQLTGLAKYEFIEFKPVKHAPGFDPFL